MFNKIVNKTVVPIVIFLMIAVSITVIFVLFDIREKFTITIEDKINSTLTELESKLNLIDDYVIG